MHVSLQGLLIFIIVFTPLAHASVTILPLTVLETTASLMVLLWCLEMCCKRKLSFARSGFFLPLLLLVILVIFQLMPLPYHLIKVISGKTINLYQNFLPQGLSRKFFTLNIFPDAGIQELIKLLSYVGVFFLVIHKVETRKQLDFIINVIIFLGLAISLFGIIKKFAHSSQVHYFNPREMTGGPFGPFANRNNFSGYINLIIPLGIGYFFTDMPLAKRFIYGFSVGLMSLALFLSLSRSGILVYIFTILGMLTFLRLKGAFRDKIKVSYILAFLVFCLFIFFLEAEVVLNRFNELFHSDLFVNFGHGYPWLNTLSIWRDFPLFGTGLGTFASISSMYKTLAQQSLFTYAHNDYLQLLSETGLAGFSLAGLFFILYLKSVIKMWHLSQDQYVSCLVLGGILSISGMLVYSLLDFNLHIPANALMFFIIMGLVYRLAFIQPDIKALPQDI